MIKMRKSPSNVASAPFWPGPATVPVVACLASLFPFALPLACLFLLIFVARCCYANITSAQSGLVSPLSDANARRCLPVLLLQNWRLSRQPRPRDIHYSFDIINPFSRAVQAPTQAPPNPKAIRRSNRRQPGNDLRYHHGVTGSVN
ncbi:hypothetical protein GGI42DRAFT_8786 [Trichoderma sp. SZMC 28013]